MSLEDKVVVVTGAGRGIGAGIAGCFANRGARVVVTDLDQESVDTTADSLPGDAMGLVADAASQDVMAEALDQVVERYGRLDILVNNAGVGGPTTEYDEVGTDSSVMSMSDETWDAHLMYNLRTAFSSSRAAIPRMEEGGSIVNIASIAGLGPSPQLPAYGAAKAGVIHLTGTLALELAPRRIRVNCICPGLLWTRAWQILASQMKANQKELANLSERQIFEGIVEQLTPLGGEQTPEDIGNLAVFFSSEEARMITGQIVAVDGGIRLQGGRS